MVEQRKSSGQYFVDPFTKRVESMRQDMAKVIVERPRYGSRLPSRKKGYGKFTQSTEIADLPKHEPMLGRWRGRQRWLNEHLGPMRRFLRSNIGRPWNKVHQELCEYVSFDNAVQAHVLTHVHDYVQRHVEICGRRIIAVRQWGHRREMRPGEMYICPNTGLLKEVKRNKSRRPPSQYVLDPVVRFMKRDESWWEVRVRTRPEEPSIEWDVWLEKDVAATPPREYEAAYGGKLFAVSKRALTPQETREVRRRLRMQNHRRRRSRPRR